MLGFTGEDRGRPDESNERRNIVLKSALIHSDDGNEEWTNYIDSIPIEELEDAGEYNLPRSKQKNEV